MLPGPFCFRRAGDAMLRDSALWCRPSGNRFACWLRRPLRGCRSIPMTCCLLASNRLAKPIWRCSFICWVTIGLPAGFRAGPESRLARPGLSSKIWVSISTSWIVCTHTPASFRTRVAMVTPLSNTDREIVILALHPGRMAMVCFFDLASLEFTISINRWDTPRNKTSLLAGRCQSGH